MQVDFYHLTLTPLARALPQIAQKVLASGERLLIVSASEEQRGAIDRLLWTFAADSFLPHACAGSGDDSVQPVLIASETAPKNAARMIALIDGVWRDEALTFERAFHFFDEDAILPARAAWKALADRDGIDRRYWKQTDNGWKQAA
ncbi:DNA polymerase III subunit chi [Sphingomonas sp. 37zxx]|uniref:DNA polymerase III subunit chi n=1 Tax=Sphingomonas sp. 37zxx TaxID=1550073 RepID=UPI00053BE51A|nr:DNA polymerase III subunit chi [Sphingomonas sp. 37zxx]